MIDDENESLLKDMAKLSSEDLLKKGVDNYNAQFNACKKEFVDKKPAPLNGLRCALYHSNLNLLKKVILADAYG